MCKIAVNKVSAKTIFNTDAETSISPKNVGGIISDATQAPTREKTQINTLNLLNGMQREIKFKYPQVIIEIVARVTASLADKQPVACKTTATKTLNNKSKPYGKLFFKTYGIKSP